ncbi:hypothetical protein ACFV27_21025 [Streptomyces antimycoticus]|uniref:hypothetical protein n=1 Tax=Streptomyces antimycoticus TaxID=68175 RepID=UPI003675110B
MTAPADMFSAHLHSQRGDAGGTRRVLGRAEVSVIQMLQGLHDLRVVIGDMEEEEE